jgi:tRNA (guanine-N7-)-methyltransferase
VIELIPESYVAPLDAERIFVRAAPLQVDLGCGDGGFLLAMAERHPDRNFLGIERQAGRVAKICRRAANIENIRVLHLETSYAVRYLLPENSVETFYLLFPDPWPKRRHRCRRIVTTKFLESIHRALAPGGSFHIATDQRDYFEQIECLAHAAPPPPALSDDDGKLDGLKPSSFLRDKSIDVGRDLPGTKFERRFREQGAPIYRLALRKVSPVM